MKKKFKLKTLIIFSIITITLLTTCVFAFVGIDGMENGFLVENGLTSNLNNVAGIVQAELKYVFNERKEIKVVESTSDDVDTISRVDGSSVDDLILYEFGGYYKDGESGDYVDGENKLTENLASTGRKGNIRTIMDLVDFLNDGIHFEGRGGSSHGISNKQDPFSHKYYSTGHYALYYFPYVYCLRHYQEIGKYKAYLTYVYDNYSTYEPIHTKFTPITKDTPLGTYETVYSDHEDYFEGSTDNPWSLSGDGHNPFPDHVDPYYTSPTSYSTSGITPGGLTVGTAKNVEENNSRIIDQQLKFAMNNIGKIEEVLTDNNTSIGDRLVDKLGGSDPVIVVPGPPPTRNKWDKRDYRSFTSISNVIYYLDEDQCTEVEPVDFYNFDNGLESGATKAEDTNVVSYGVAFSLKTKVAATDTNNIGYWERAQADIWAVFGDPAFSSYETCDPASDIATTITGEYSSDPDQEDSGPEDASTYTVAGNGYNPNTLCLYKAGTALDLYEQALTKNESGSEQAKHDKAVEGTKIGTEDYLRDKPFVSIKDKGTVDFADSFSKVEDSVSFNDDFDEAADIGTSKDATGTTIPLNEDGSCVNSLSFEMEVDGTSSTDTLSGEYFYRIGPFTMSDYCYAASEHIEKYSGEDVEKYKKLLGGIIYGELKFINDDGSETATVEIGANDDDGEKAKIIYEDTYEGTDNGESSGTDAFLEPVCDDKKTITIGDKEYVYYKDYEYPRPKSVFYVIIPKDLCGDGATTLKNISFMYRQTYSTGDGWVINHKYIWTLWEAGTVGDGCSTYKCTADQAGGTADGNYWKDSGDCDFDSNCTDYSHSNDVCSGERGDKGEDYGGSNHDDKCEACHCPEKGTTCGDTCCYAVDDDGNKYSTCNKCCGHTDDCHGFVYCKHGYRYCMQTSKYRGQSEVKEGQPLMAVHKSRVAVRDYFYEGEVNVRLTTKVTINKYIYDVEHDPDATSATNNISIKENDNDTLDESDYNSTYPEAIMDSGDNGLGKSYSEVSREKISENDKEENPVYVEYGDIVTYHIQLINQQKKDVTVKIIDTIPGNAILLSVDNITEELQSAGVTGSNGNTTDNFKPAIEVGDGKPVRLQTDGISDPVYFEDITDSTDKTDVTLEEPDESEELSTFKGKEQYFTTGWIAVPGRKGSDDSNIVTLAVRVRVIRWENAEEDSTVSGINASLAGGVEPVPTPSGTGTVLKWENKTRIITRNCGPTYSPYGTEEFKDGDKLNEKYVEDYMRVVDNGIKYEDLENERDAYDLYDSIFPLDSTTLSPDNTVHGPVVNLAELDPALDDPNATLPDAVKLKSSDWYILNNYDAFIDKHVYQYDEIIQENNEGLDYTQKAYITYENTGIDINPELGYYDRTIKDEVLSFSRANFSDEYNKELNDDGNMKDTVRKNHNDDAYIDERANEKYKKNHPVSVEKTEIFTYAIKISNEAEMIEDNGTNKISSGTGNTHVSGSKPATQVRTTKVTDYLEKGLIYTGDTDNAGNASETSSYKATNGNPVTAKIYDKTGAPIERHGGTENVPVTVKKVEEDVSIEGRNYTVYEYDIDDKTILNPGDYIVYFVEVEVTQSNMYLNDLENKANITVLTNINYNEDDEERVIRAKNEVEPNKINYRNYGGSVKERDENISEQEVSSDFIRLKDLVIAGRVWIDFNRDGYMNEDVNEYGKLTEGVSPLVTADKLMNEYYSIDEYGRKQAVTVKLYRVEKNQADGTLLRTTQTDENGLFTFGRKNTGTDLGNGATETLLDKTKSDSMEYYDDYNYIYNGETIGLPEKLKASEYSDGAKYQDSIIYQRVDKATNKDKYGNYTDSSDYIEYYVEYEYDGVLYRSTEFYSGADNIDLEKDDKYGQYDREKEYSKYAARDSQIHNDEGKDKDAPKDGVFTYEIDSNAAEFRDVRKKYNTKYQYISYNVGYRTVDESGNVKNSPMGSKIDGGDLVYDKTDHTSQLMEDQYRKLMTARSFIKNATLAGLNGSEKLPEDVNSYHWDDVAVDKTGDATNTLWLAKHNKDEQRYKLDPETEYLKHINLGLELREDVDIALTKDVYKIKTTINGEEMEYTYNLNNGLNGEMAVKGTDSKEYLKDYIVEKPYGLELYESDYKFRFDQYKAQAVREYKEDKSELNIEVTYRITVNNRSVSDDDLMRDSERGDKPEVKDTKFKVKVHEILDLYDANFKKIDYMGGKMAGITFDAEKGPQVANVDVNNAPTTGTNFVTVKVKDDNGYLHNKMLVVAEAWYFVPDADGEYIIEKGSDYETNKKAAENGSEKPVYTLADKDVEGIDGQRYKKHFLEITEKSNGYSDTDAKPNDFLQKDGYRTAYIQCTDARTQDNEDYFTIPEGEERDIYVKYVIDKSTLEITENSESYKDTQQVITRTTDGDFEFVEVTTESYESSRLDRSLHIREWLDASREENKGSSTKQNPRGTENVAQVNAYSVWYQHNDLPASIVDMDSNAGNIGDENKTKSNEAAHGESSDKIELYEDTAYKTGVEIIAEGTENTEDDILFKETTIIFRLSGKEQLKRELTGMVWDDCRSETLQGKDTNGKDQYIANGVYKVENDDKDEANEEAKINENVEVNYKEKEKNVTEKNDITVRSANVELVEIVEIPNKTNCPVCGAKGGGENPLTTVSAVATNTTGGSGGCNVCTGTDEAFYYEEVLSNVTWAQTQHKRTGDEGEYLLDGFIPGKYIVRFSYGDTITQKEIDDMSKLKDLNMTVEAFAAQTQRDMQIFNGQDYKSTKYTYNMKDYENAKNGENTVGKDAKLAELDFADSDIQSKSIDEFATSHAKTPTGGTGDATDTVIVALETPNLSDARDDEIRRLEVNNYSEIMINQKAEILKGLGNGTLTISELENENISVNYYDDLYQVKGNDDKDLNKGTVEKAKAKTKAKARAEAEGITDKMKRMLTELTDNTNMYADTVEFLVKAEKLTYDQTTEEKYIYHNYTKDDAMKIYYDMLKNMEFQTVAEREFSIKNIDMGVEYRAETGIDLTKEIDRIQLVTSDDKLILDLLVKTRYNSRGGTKEDLTDSCHYIDMERSIGAELVQFVSNDYIREDLLQGIIDVDNENLQGFMYIAVDEDILQGCKVIIQYKFVTQNDSELDRVANTLNQIRFEKNYITQKLKGGYNIKNVVPGMPGVTGELTTDSDFFINMNRYCSVCNRTINKDVDKCPTCNEELVITKEYTANNFARNMVHHDVYQSSDNTLNQAKFVNGEQSNKDVYRDRPKTMINDPSNKDTTLDDDADKTNGYYGKYVAYTYYTGGDIGVDSYKDHKQALTTNGENLDAICELKFDRVIDFVDTDLEFGQLSQKDLSRLSEINQDTPEDVNNPLKGIAISIGLVKEALLNGDINQDIGSTVNSSNLNLSAQTVFEASTYLYSLNKAIGTLDPKFFEQLGMSLEDGSSGLAEYIKSTLGDVLIDLDGIKYKSIIVTIPDKQKDEEQDKYDDDINLDHVVTNTEFSKFLKPSILDNPTDDASKNYGINSISQIKLPVSKELATETDTENMQYENIAEVIQFTILTGRRTNFDTTIGNADIHEVDRQNDRDKYNQVGSVEFVTAAFEKDTSSTETITLTPPTGLMRSRIAIYDAIDVTRDISMVVVIAVAAVVIILGTTKVTITKVKKRRYK